MVPTRPSLRRPTQHSTILRNLDSDALLRQNGFVVLQSVVGDEQIRHLQERYLDLSPASDEGLTVDYMRPDRDLVRRIADLLEPACHRIIADVFVDQRAVMSTFVVKHPGVASEMFLHDDRTYVDETRFSSTTLWIPLVDVGPGVPNGGLQVIPGSHLLPARLSGSNTPDLYRPWERSLRAGLQPISAKAGQAVAYDTRILHASGPNMTDLSRVAIVCATAPRGADLLHVVATGRRHRMIYAVDTDFFLDQHPREIPRQIERRYPLVRELDESVAIRPEDVQAVVGLCDGDPRVPIPMDVCASTERDSLDALPMVRTIEAEKVDLRVSVEALGRRLGEGAVLDISEVPDGCGVAALCRGGRGREKVSGVQRWRRLLTSAVHRDVDLIVLAPGARLAATARVAARWVTELVAVEAPSVGAGVRSTHAVGPLDIGAAVTVPHSEELLVWNDGPGQLVLLAALVPDPASLLGAVLHRLGRRTLTVRDS